MYNITREEIVTSSELVKNFSNARKKAKENPKAVIFKNNKPDLVLLDINEYERLYDISELLEDVSIMEMVIEREKRDTGNRRTHEEVKLLLKDRIARLKKVNEEYHNESLIEA